jgi:hypothetical protein
MKDSDIDYSDIPPARGGVFQKGAITLQSEKSRSTQDAEKRKKSQAADQRR